MLTQMFSWCLWKEAPLTYTFGIKILLIMTFANHEIPNSIINVMSHSFPKPLYFLLCIHDLNMAIGLLLSNFNMAIAISNHMKYKVKNHLVVVHNRLPHILVLGFVYFHFSWAPIPQVCDQAHMQQGWENMLKLLSFGYWKIIWLNT